MDGLINNTYEIYGKLLKAVLKGYAGGRKSKLGRRPKFDKLPVNIDWTVEDIHAIQNFRTEAFTVAGVASYDLEEELKELALKYKDDFNEFEENARRKMLEYGIGLDEQAPTGWLKTNLNTAINSSYSAAEWIKLQDPVLRSVYPAYRYRTVGDNRVRPEHARLDKLVYAADDPIWQSIWPPNSWNCRCYTEALDHTEAGIEKIQPTTQAERKKIIAEGKIHKDFSRNAGITKSIWGKWLKEKLQDKKYNDITERMRIEANKMPEPEVVIQNLTQYAVKFRELEYSKENFDNDFPSGIADTPLGKFKFGDDFFDKIARTKRQDIFGLIKPTVEEPEYIIIDKNYATLFLKAFEKNKVKIFTGVLKEKDGENLIISFHQKGNIINKVKDGKLLVYSFLRESATSGGAQQLTARGSRLNFVTSNITQNVQKDYTSFRVLNVSDQDIDIIQKPDEVWAELIFASDDKPSTSVIYYIKYSVDGFRVTASVNGRAVGSVSEPYNKINDYRTGMLLYNRV